MKKAGRQERTRRSRVVLKEHIKNNKAVFITYLILRCVVLAALVLCCLRRDWENAFICVLVLFIYMLPGFIQANFGIEFPSFLEIVILVFVFAAEIQGELQCYFVQFRYWDTMLHTTWGFLCAAIGFSLVDILNRNKTIRFELAPCYLALTAFCFSMTIGVLWEFVEFSADRLLMLDMQKDTVISVISSVALDLSNSNRPVIIEGINDVIVNQESLGLGGYLDIGLYDTMEDMFVNFLGALTFSIIGYFDAKSHGRFKLVGNLVPRLREDSGEQEEEQ